MIPSAMDEHNSGTGKSIVKKQYFWILLGGSLISIFMLASRTGVLQSTFTAYRHGYTEVGKRYRIHIMHKTYATAKPDGSDVLTNECSHSSRLCSDSAIRNCAVASDHFPKEQHWRNTNSSFPDARFEPRFCRFKYDTIPPQLLQRCLQHKQTKRIAVIGDSNGNRYFNALLGMLDQIANCTKVRSAFSLDYFSRRKRRAKKLPKQKQHRRRNGLVECVFANASDETGSDNEASASLPRSVLIEIITVISYRDKQLPNTRNCSTEPINRTNKCAETEPRMLFPTLFGDYFAREKYPDVIMLFSNSHDKGNGKTVNQTRSHIAALRDIVNRYVPRGTAFYWFSHLSENELKRKVTWQNILYEGKYTANEMIFRTNRAMYDVLRDDFREGWIRTFFDLYSMTLPVPDWSHDGIHLKEDWYKYLVSYWFQMTCSKFM